MSLNLLPRRGPVVSVALDEPETPEMAEAVTLAVENGWDGIELAATGEPPFFHSPTISPEVRATLREMAAPLLHVAVQAPHQTTWDVTLVSPSSAIRRASLSEIWSVCKFAQAVSASPLPPVVMIRTGMPPFGVGPKERDGYLAECLTTLDRTAREQGVLIGLLNRDRFHHLGTLEELDELPLAHTGVALDIGYALHIGESPARIISILGERSRVTSGSGRIVYVRVPCTLEGAARDQIAQAIRALNLTGAVCLTQGAGTADDLIAARHWWQPYLEQTLDREGETS